MEKALSFEGCNYFRQRLVLSTLTSRPVRITNIREGSEQPGIRGGRALTFDLTLYTLLCMNVEFEAGFIRLLDKLTNGSKIEVNETGRLGY